MPSILRFDDDGREIGELVWDERPGATYEMHLDVAEGCRRKGVGRSMFNDLESIVRERRGMSIYSFMAADNQAAIGFFRAMGFVLSRASDFYGHGRDAMFACRPVGRPK